MLTGKQIRVARHYAEGWLNKRQLCKKCKIARPTLNEWLLLPDFAAQVKAFRDDYVKRVRTEGIASLENRIRLYNQMENKLRRVIHERAKDPTMSAIPGGKTGVLVRRLKSIGSGENQTMVEEYEVDTATLKELREMAMQASKELGQINRAAENETDGEDLTIRIRPVKKRASDNDTA